ncbi:MAG: triacylglycerol lipase [Dysgonomonas sp.]|nr:triacylglycerol lipase [Dysgonomonas sp.]
MDLFLHIIYFFIISIFIIIDIKKGLLYNWVLAIILMLVVNNSFLFLSAFDLFAQKNDFSLDLTGQIFSIILFLYIWLRIQLIPCAVDTDISRMVKIVYRGRRLLLLALILLFIQLIVLFNYTILNDLIPITTEQFRNNNILAFIAILLTFLNGWFRIFIFSTRLRVLRRIIVSILIWIPVINIFVILYMCKMAAIEYDHACNKAYNENMRKDSLVCETKYPLLMLHGVGFRDFKYINYWGRIPKYLVRNGARVYYGHQEALGTIKDNAAMVKDKIMEIIEETGCDKVNIIAHSKGGLDARYTITTLGMSDYVASLTTISTPHRGSTLADFGDKYISDKLYRKVANIFDKYFLKIGDKNPDFYTAMHQFTQEYAEEFNKNTLDAESVYYQSYMSLMKNCFSHSLLSIPYLIMCFSDKQNDGLVTLDSAKWGEFRETFTNKRFRGISHGDMIDLTRGNYRNFDVIEVYIKMVADLKAKGF